MAGVLVGLAIEQLDLGAQHGERRAQLVRGVGDEVALARERALEAIEHAVERVRPARRPRRARRRIRALGERSPESTAAATRAIRRSGRAISVAISTPAATASTSASEPTSANVRSRLACASLDGVSGSATYSVPTPPAVVAIGRVEHAHLAGFLDEASDRPAGASDEPVDELVLLLGLALALARLARARGCAGGW